MANILFVDVQYIIILNKYNVYNTLITISYVVILQQTTLCTFQMSYRLYTCIHAHEVNTFLCPRFLVPALSHRIPRGHRDGPHYPGRRQSRSSTSATELPEVWTLGVYGVRGWWHRREVYERCFFRKRSLYPDNLLCHCYCFQPLFVLVHVFFSFFKFKNLLLLILYFTFTISSFYVFYTNIIFVMLDNNLITIKTYIYHFKT